MFFDKPTHVGFTILERSKLIMAQFWYETLTPMFGAENFRLVYTGRTLSYWRIPILVTLIFADTDSFYIEFLDSTWTEAVDTLKEHIDFSNFPETHDFFKTHNYGLFAKDRKAQFGYGDEFLKKTKLLATTLSLSN